jgi:acyl dehydratase
VDYDRIKNWWLPDLTVQLSDREAILYALSVGYGADPLDERELRFVYERDLAPTPTLASVIGYPGFWMQDPATGIDWVRVVHGEQRITLDQPLPIGGTYVCRNRVEAIVDKGPDVGAVVYQRRTIRDRESDRVVAEVDHVTFCRGDGGFGGGDDPPPPPEPVPTTAPDAVCDLPTFPQSALLYRLMGDRNPLHADPAVALEAGYRAPILHGLVTYAVSSHAILRTLCGYDPDRFTSVFARFSAPVYPGETIRTEMWRENGSENGSVRFQARALERDVIVLSHGAAEIA